MSTGGPPPELFERARMLRDGLITAVGTRDAATIALLRDAPGGPEVYLLRRVRGMAFAGGMHVFPGGSVDPADATADIAWAGPSAAAWAAHFGVDEPLARALVCAAVRETFEESGVLLAGPSADEVLADVSTDEWEAERAALEAREHSLSELLARRSLVLRTDLLRPLAHWITPEVEAKRFDTRFFLARMPAGQVCREVGGEADQRVWVRPADALEQGLRMLPPTAVALQDLAAFAEVDAALAAERTIRPVLPKLVVADDDSVAFLLPGDAGYPA
ncbi:MAG: hydrolase [Frankiales bacterium]|jgi:8-oxo-dGTP pyrophosphatase MutT (NUDIX family)|nr:hydrolase [Frankiales bacterium]